MSARTDRLALQWRTQADTAEHEADCHRLMAIEDDVNDRAAMSDRNRRTAARLQGVADGLRQCARQLTTEVVS